MASADIQQVFAFADVQVDTRAHRVLKAGVELNLEPKAYGVLLELLRRAGEAVGRDALLDAVWGHRHVTPAVLNRIIALLRKALGDDADSPHLIRTVHGVGYAFIGTLSPPAAEAGSSPIAGAVPQPAERDSRSGRTRRTAILAAVALALALTFLASWPPREAADPATVATSAPAAGPDAPRAVLVAVLPLAVAEGDDLSGVAESLSESLDEMLARLSGVSVITRESARIATERAPDARGAGALMGADYVLHGRLTQRPDDAISLDLAMLRTRDGATVWASAFQQPRDQLVRVMGPILDGVQRIVRPEAPLAGDPLVRATPTAQELYWAARQVRIGPSSARRRRAIELLEQAIALDPKFALAYCDLALNWRFLAIQGSVGLDEGVARARAAVARALELDPTLVCAHAEDAFLYTSQWRAPQALPAVRRALELAPNDAHVIALAGNVATHLGNPREGLRLHEQLRDSDPLSWLLRGTMWNDQLQLGRADAALRTIDELRKQPEWGEVAARIARIRVLVAIGRHAEAIALGRAEAERPDTTIYVVASIAQALSEIGMTEAAESIMAPVVPGRSSNPLLGDTRMSLFWRAGRTREAMAWIEGPGATAVQEPWRSTWRAHARALTGDLAGAVADYDAALATDIDRQLIAHSWYTVRFGLNQLANRAVARREAGLDAAAATEAFRERLRAMLDGGTAIAAIDYAQAMDAALSGDAEGADAHLAGALEKGWRDSLAFDTDLVWREYAATPWLARHRRTLDDALAAERAKVESGQ